MENPRIKCQIGTRETPRDNFQPPPPPPQTRCRQHQYRTPARGPCLSPLPGPPHPPASPLTGRPQPSALPQGWPCGEYRPDRQLKPAPLHSNYHRAGPILTPVPVGGGFSYTEQSSDTSGCPIVQDNSDTARPETVPVLPDCPSDANPKSTLSLCF